MSDDTFLHTPSMDDVPINASIDWPEQWLDYSYKRQPQEQSPKISDQRYVLTEQEYAGNRVHKEC